LALVGPADNSFNLNLNIHVYIQYPYSSGDDGLTSHFG